MVEKINKNSSITIRIEDKIKENQKEIAKKLNINKATVSKYLKL